MQFLSYFRTKLTILTISTPVNFMWWQKAWGMERGA